MKASTCPQGPRSQGARLSHAHVLRFSTSSTAPAYLVRTELQHRPPTSTRPSRPFTKAFQNQLDGKGFSMVEIVTSCPTNWGLDPMKALEYIEEKMLPEFPLGVVRDR